MENAKMLGKVKGVSNVKGYCLVNNYGYTFEKNGKRYDARFWENCYGCYLGYWTVDCQGFYKGNLKTFEDVIKVVEEL